MDIFPSSEQVSRRGLISKLKIPQILSFYQLKMLNETSVTALVQLSLKT